MPQNLFKITAEECKQSFAVDVRRSTTSLLKVVLKMTENGIYALPMKVIPTSLVCLFFADRITISIAVFCLQNLMSTLCLHLHGVELHGMEVKDVIKLIC